MASNALPRGWALVALDFAVALWVLAWVLLGGAVATRVDRLASVGGALTQVADAEDTMAGSLQPLAHLPFVNLNLGPLQDQLRTAAATSRASAGEEAASIHSLARLSGLGVVLLSLFPVLFLYLPARLVRLQDVWAVRRDLARHAGDPGLDAYLAQRALVNLPYRKLRRFSEDPARDLASGRWDGLAEAELQRLGLRRASRRHRRQTA